MERFSSVKKVYVYSFVLECLYCGEHIALDDTTGQNVVPFISSLRNISSCYLGDLSKDNFDCSCWPDVQNKEVVTDLIEKVYTAYTQHDLQDHVKIVGLLPNQDDLDKYNERWKLMPLCGMICHSFPSLQVMRLDDGCVLCISCQNRLKIVQLCDGKNSLLTLHKCCMKKLLQV